MLARPRCFERGCIHLQGTAQPNGTETGERAVCAAYPDGIPTKIAYGENLHLTPEEGDHGVQFEEEEA